MGLAASQARFLAITARKADCEFRSMQIAQNKLSVTRELQAATEKWQNSLNAEMLVWDYDGTASDLQAVSYSIMTKPSAYNNYTPYLLTDRGGRVIVSQEIAAAALAAGINPDKGGSRSEINFNKFISALVGSDVISEQTAEDIHNATFGPNAKYVDFDGNTYKCGSKDTVPVYVDAKGNVLGTVFKTAPNEDVDYNWQTYYNNAKTNDAPKGSSIAYAVIGPNNSILNLYRICQTMTGECPYPREATVNGNNKVVYDPAGVTAPNKLTTDDVAKYWGVHIVQSNYDVNNGYGSEPMSKNALTGINLAQLADAFNKKKIVNAGTEVTLNNLTLSSTGLGTNGGKTGFYAKENGSKVDFSSISLSDVLTGNVVLCGTHADDDHEYHDDFNTYLGNYLKAAACQIGIALGAFKQGTTDPSNSANYIDSDYGQKFYMAYRFTEMAFAEGSPTTISTKKTGDSKTQELAISEAQNQNGVVFYKNQGTDYNSASAVSVSNMLSYFLTYVTIMEDGFDSGYSAMDKVSNSKFVTNDPEYRWVVNAAETETNDAVMKSDFYQQLFNNLCINGYKVDQRVKNDNDYLEQMLKNGSYFICSLGVDGYFYQSRYNDAENTLVKVIPDEDAIAVAESEYNYMKIKLTAKEDKLDLDMKNIDMEISALTTEYDSVKNLIAKSIEKTFKQFEG